MRIIALDLSLSCTGWGVLVADGCAAPQIEKYGNFLPEGRAKNYGEYPWCYVLAAESMAAKVYGLILATQPDEIVIEETTKGRASASSQKCLEFLHCCLLRFLLNGCRSNSNPPVVKYIKTGDWRKTIGLELTKADKLSNRKVGEILRKTKDPKERNQLKKAKGVGGKVTKKHAAVVWANSAYHLNLRPKDADIADALALGSAFLMGAKVVTLESMQPKCKKLKAKAI